MKKLSYWAKDHVWESRLLIITMWLVLNILGIFAGKLFTEIDIKIPEYYWTVCIIFAVLLCGLYPDRKSSTLRSSSFIYARRKLFDFSLCMVTFMMIIYSGNRPNTLFTNAQYVHATSIIPVPKDSSIRNHPLIKNFILKLKSPEVLQMSSREKMKLIKQQLRSVNADKEISKGTKTLLITLTVLLGIGLIMGIAALSCSLACSGSEALAAIVAIGGTFLVVFLAVRLIKQISRRAEKKKSENDVEK